MNLGTDFLYDVEFHWVFRLDFSGKRDHQVLEGNTVEEVT